MCINFFAIETIRIYLVHFNYKHILNWEETAVIDKSIAKLKYNMCTATVLLIDLNDFIFVFDLKLFITLVSSFYVYRKSSINLFLL